MRYAPIGGQAVIEGVMMRYGNQYAVAVRKSDQSIEVKKDNYTGLVTRLHLRHVPIIRGMFAFIDSLVLGMSTLTYSASFYDDEEEEEEKAEDKKGKAEADCVTDNNDRETAGNNCSEADDNKDRNKKNNSSDAAFNVMMGFTVVVSLALGIFLFMLTPYFISTLFGRIIPSTTVQAVIEGVIRMAIFLIYMVAISRMKDIQRVFMYHGAEHKTITCIERGMELTPENAAKCTRLHKRCGTSFLLIVMIVSIVCFIFIRSDNYAMRVALRIILIPVISGISYELIQLAGRSESRLSDILSAPGLWLQKYFTTREPDESMLEVAIASIEAIYDWKEFQRNELAGAAESETAGA